VLNEYKRLYPDRDPVDVHQRLWGVRLVCPAGGHYVWNDQYKTLESTAVGHPGKPKDSPNLTSPVLGLFRDGNFGLDFEHGGLRAKAVLHRARDEQK
jgi:hypothetical protein